MNIRMENLKSVLVSCSSTTDSYLSTDFANGSECLNEKKNEEKKKQNEMHRGRVGHRANGLLTLEIRR